MSDLVKFSELLKESQEGDFRTPEMITESENSTRQWVDSNYITVTKINDKDVIKYMNKNERKSIITTNGEWKMNCGSSGRWWSVYFYKTGNFYKNGTSPMYSYSCNDDTTEKSFQETFSKLFADNHSDLEKTLQALIDFYAAKENQPSGNFKINAYKEDEANRSNKMFQPFAALKNVKPYAKPIPAADKINATKLTRDDVAKMIMSGQIDKIILSHYMMSDDSRYDKINDKTFEGDASDPIKVLTNDLLGTGNSGTYVNWRQEGGRVYINVSPHSNKSYNVILDEKKFKK